MEDEIPLSERRSPVMSSTREKLDQLLDEAFRKGKNKKEKGGKKKSKRKKLVEETELGVDAPSQGRDPEKGTLPPLRLRRPSGPAEPPISVITQDETQGQLTVPVAARPRSSRQRQQREDLLPAAAASSTVSTSGWTAPEEAVTHSSSSRRTSARRRAAAAEDTPENTTPQQVTREADAHGVTVQLHTCRLPGGTWHPRTLSVRVSMFDGETGALMCDRRGDSLTPVTSNPCTRFRGEMALLEGIPKLRLQGPGREEDAPHATLMFELLAPPPPASLCYPACALQQVSEQCVGWSFLRLRLGEEESNCARAVRLQIFQPPSSLRGVAARPANVQTVLGWWRRSSSWRKLAGCSLQVTVLQQEKDSPISRPARGGTAEGSKSAEPGKPALEITDTSTPQDQGDGLESPLGPSWRRRPSTQLCRPPCGPPLLQLPPSTASCLAIAFSPRGEWLACAGAHNIILIFKVPELRRVVHELQGHSGLVYDISWMDENRLVSASADCTARVWHVSQQTFQLLPHPTFVYCCVSVMFSTPLTEEDEEEGGPSRGHQVVTGARDGVVRVWRLPTGQENQQLDLWQELEGHLSMVTSLCLLQSAEHELRLVSGDSEGAILVWQREESSPDWSLDFRRVDACGGSCVSRVAALPSPCGSETRAYSSRVLVGAESGLLTCLDLKTGTTLVTYRAPLITSRVGCCASPCGSLVLGGSERGGFSTWRAETGALLSEVSRPDLEPGVPCSALTHHPRGHLLVTAYFGHRAVPAAVWAGSEASAAAAATPALPSPQGILESSAGLEPPRGGVRLNEIITKIDRVLRLQPPHLLMT